MLRRLLYSWHVRFAVILPLVHVIVSGLLLGSAPVPDENATNDLMSEPLECRIIFALNPPGIVIAALLHFKGLDDRNPRHVIWTGAALGGLFWWRLGLYIDRARRRDPISKSIILLCATVLWTLIVWAGWLDARELPSTLINLAILLSAALLWPAAGFLAARDVRPKHLIS